MRALILTVSTLVFIVAAAPGHAADLSGAKALYASASYEEALVMLATLEATESLEQVNQLRALCLLALGRSQDAERAVEQIIVANPTYAPENAEVSPKLVTLFRDVRRRVLPIATRSLYVKAKTSYDEKRWGDAQREFQTLLRLIADPDVAEHRASLADLQQLGEGFLALSEVEVAAESRRKEAAAAAAAAAAIPPPAPAPAAKPTAASTAAAGGAAVPPARAVGSAGINATVYTALDRNVTPPVEQRRVMPRWTPANRAIAIMTLTGLLEIVIDETGAVASAAMAKPVTPGYDQALLQAARTWRYTPARRDGKPVRYRQVLEIVLRPSQIRAAPAPATEQVPHSEHSRESGRRNAQQPGTTAPDGLEKPDGRGHGCCEETGNGIGLVRR